MDDEARACEIYVGGDVWTVPLDGAITIGREATIQLDDNPYLHRVFLQVHGDGELWWLSNVGSRLVAHVTDAGGVLRATLIPGGRLPLVFEWTAVTFSAGSTAYHLAVLTPSAAFHPARRTPIESESAVHGTVVFTTSQRALIVALAEPLLRDGGATVSDIPSSAAAAHRLGWTLTRFTRKLDNVCDKLDAIGVGGLRGSAGKLATQRRARLVEYALSTRLVTERDLPLLDQVFEAGEPTEFYRR